MSPDTTDRRLLHPAAVAPRAGYPNCSGICALTPPGSGDPRRISAYLLQETTHKSLKYYNRRVEGKTQATPRMVLII